MNDKKYKGISGATVVVFIAVIFFVLWMTSRVQMRGQEITFTQFEQEIKDDNVTEVVINQNKAVPTGVVTLTLRDSRETGRVNVSDVNETQKLLDKNDVEYRISAIPQDSVLSTTVLPVVLMLVGFMFITMMMNRQSGGAMTDFQQILQFHKGKRSEVVNRELGYIFTKQNNKKDNHRHSSGKSRRNTLGCSTI